ncbi:hypothetical protein GPECTOR_93g616 [Gonium pectorale]|uniref:Uncharacterized protein n=1 Tax=Gonium pectorale TaxID=33097 RepID=A0A150G0E4_GONPE|nr:hypothetical protein GPECTOR_93g616 [Gonium pectorale]|eukprot:KXZ43346.1 hypothetical protein GPECTOR_93g616 [Gonium pectorale]
MGYGDTNTRGDNPGEMGDNLPFVDLGTGRTAVAMAAGAYHTCAILDTARVKCWGRAANGQLGYGDTNNRGDNPGEMGDNLPFVDLGTGRTAVVLAGGHYHTCAVLDNGRAKCWGWNNAAQLGYGDTNNRGDNPGEMGDSLPFVDLGTGRTAVAMAGGELHTCAVLDNGRAKCWGVSSLGQLGYGDTSIRGDNPGEMGDSLPYVDLGTGRTAVVITAGTYHSCAVLDNARAKCWGPYYFGQLGYGDLNTRGDGPGEMGDNLPYVDLGTGRTAVALATGAYHNCAILDNRRVKCWGYALWGQLGYGDTLYR